MSPKLTTKIMSRRRLVAAIKKSLSYGEARPLAARIGLVKGRFSRALDRPDEFTRDFEKIAAHCGYECRGVDGFYKQRECVA